jgi:hypothetical protein
MGAEFVSCERTDGNVTKLIVAFRDSVKAPAKENRKLHKHVQHKRRIKNRAMRNENLWKYQIRGTGSLD